MFPTLSTGPRDIKGQKSLYDAHSPEMVQRCTNWSHETRSRLSLVSKWLLLENTTKNWTVILEALHTQVIWETNNMASKERDIFGIRKNSFIKACCLKTHLFCDKIRLAINCDILRCVIIKDVPSWLQSTLSQGLIFRYSIHCHKIIRDSAFVSQIIAPNAFKLAQLHQ